MPKDPTEVARIRRRFRKENHICQKCGRPAYKKYTYCEECLAYYRNRSNQYYLMKCMKALEKERADG